MNILQRMITWAGPDHPVPNEHLAELLVTPLSTAMPVPPTTPPAPPTLSLEAAREILKQIEKVGVDLYSVDPRCPHCKGIHDRSCPRVREIQYSPAGGIIAVKFWRKWNDDNVLWPDQIVA